MKLLLHFMWLKAFLLIKIPGVINNVILSQKSKEGEHLRYILKITFLFIFIFCPLRHFICMYYIPRKRIQGFSLLYVFELLLHVPWCQLRLSVQWNQTDGMGAGYSAIFLDLWVVHQIWGWSLHTYLACLWGSQQFSQPCDHQWFQIRQCNHASSSLLETWRWLWSMA